MKKLVRKSKVVEEPPVAKIGNKKKREYNFKKGDPKVGGRAKGTPNKTTALLKDAILMAATEAGDMIMNEDGKPSMSGLTGYLRLQAIRNPAQFLSLLGKVLPMQITGAGGGPIDTKYTIEFVEPMKVINATSEDK
jgi:hypothetical protein